MTTVIVDQKETTEKKSLWIVDVARVTGQHAANFAKSVKENPKKYLVRGGAILAGTAIGGLYLALKGEDEAEEPYYEYSDDYPTEEAPFEPDGDEPEHTDQIS